MTGKHRIGQSTGIGLQHYMGGILKIWMIFQWYHISGDNMESTALQLYTQLWSRLSSTDLGKMEHYQWKYHKFYVATHCGSKSYT
jgi:hypothetical protein